MAMSGGWQRSQSWGINVCAGTIVSYIFIEDINEEKLTDLKIMRFSLLACIGAILLITVISGCAAPVKNAKELQRATENLQKISQSKLSNLNNAVSDAAQKIAKSGLQSEETREILNGLCKKYPYLIDFNASDPTGKMITVAPEEYRRFEGTETARTEASKQFFRDFNASRKPMLSSVFRAVEGFDAVVLVWPVITEQNEVLGSVSALFKPESLLDSSIKPQTKVRAIKVNVLQTDGLCIYCSNGTETGKNLFTDAVYKPYPELIAQGAIIVAQKSGDCTFTYPSVTTGQPVKKTACWTSMGLHGTEWRILSIAEFAD